MYIKFFPDRRAKSSMPTRMRRISGRTRSTHPRTTLAAMTVWEMHRGQAGRRRVGGVDRAFPWISSQISVGVLHYTTIKVIGSNIIHISCDIQAKGTLLSQASQLNCVAKWHMLMFSQVTPPFKFTRTLTVFDFLLPCQVKFLQFAFRCFRLSLQDAPLPSSQKRQEYWCDVLVNEQHKRDNEEVFRRANESLLLWNNKASKSRSKDKEAFFESLLRLGIFPVCAWVLIPETCI